MAHTVNAVQRTMFVCITFAENIDVMEALSRDDWQRSLCDWADDINYIHDVEIVMMTDGPEVKVNVP